MAHQSLYRRYRPRRFGEVRGQDHVVRALRNAVRGETEGHAYLFSGPRGTGKTSTARILAKALNCENLQDGEPCCECSSCVDIEAGRSFDLFELDAASNNGVDAIRDLIERSVVGSPGRNKVYILDEVHMLSAAASNALLKTLEEPPEHVCFVLATTDPQKVLPTIRSRTQHFEFQLLSASELEDHVRWIVADAGLDVDDAGVAYVVRQGRGSARDTLSALDQVVAAGGVIARAEPVDQLLGALADRDSGAAIVAVADALALGHDPRVLGDAFLTALRDTFLLSLGVDVPHLVDADRERLGEWAQRLGTPTLTRAMESVGTALVDMRQAADPRVPLEVALVRLTAAPTGTGGNAAAPSAGDAAPTDGLAERVAALERALADGPPGRATDGPAPREQRRAAPAGPTRPQVQPQPDAAAAPAPASPPAARETSVPDGADDDAAAVAGGGPAQARAALGALRAKQGRTSSADAPGRAPAPSPGPAPAAPPRSPTRPVASPPAPAPAPAEPVSSGSPPSAPVPAEPVSAGSPPTVGASPGPATTDEPSTPAPGPAPTGTASAPSGGAVDRDALVLAFGDVVMPELKGMAKAIYSGGHFVAVTDQGAVFALDNAPTRDRAEKYRADVEAALGAHIGSPVHLVLIEVGDAARYATAPDEPVAPPATDATGDDAGVGDTTADDTTADDDPGMIDVSELEDATDVAVSGLDKLTKAFPGAVLVEGGEGSP